MDCDDQGWNTMKSGNDGSPQKFPGIREYLGLNRNITVLAVSTLGLALGEELWLTFLPKYLIALGATGLGVGLFSSTKDLLDGVYQYPGGWVADHLGRKKALMGFTFLAILGYALAAVTPGWVLMFPALLLIMAWKSGAFPTSFAVIADSLPQGRRGIAFSVQSIMQRFPRVIGAPLGGLLIGGLGVLMGVKTALWVTVALGAGVLITQKWQYGEQSGSSGGRQGESLASILKGLPKSLRQLLMVECCVRTGEAIAASFVILYVVDIHSVSIETYGLLYAIQQTVAILLYIPSGKLADVTGRRPIIAATFLFFALFPFAVYAATSLPLLIGAFVMGGLKEFGEPARKSFILDQVDQAIRGRAVGAYYTVRNLIIVPGGILGGILWGISDSLPLIVGCIVGMAGVLMFLVMGERVK